MAATPPAVPDDATYRLMVNKLVFTDFKSYAGEKEIGPFHSRFSAVVGPNGSGKSNVIDGMQFVFGKRASDLRFKKLSALIHKSSEHPDCVKASVAVHFHEVSDTRRDAAADDCGADAGYIVKPGSELVVKRTVTADNVSFYSVNGTRKKRAEVQTILMETHKIDLNNNRFLILQGEVEQISQMAPKARPGKVGDVGFLEYFEDITGSDRFHDEITSKEATLSEMEEDRKQALQRSRLGDTALDEQHASALEMHTFLAKEQEVHAKQHVHAQYMRHTATVESTARTERCDGLKEQRAIEMAKKAAQETEIAQKSAAVEQQHAELDGFVAASAAQRAQWTKHSRGQAKVGEEIKHLSVQQKKCGKKAKKAAKTAEEQTTRSEELASGAVEMAAEIETSHAALAQMRSDVEAEDAASMATKEAAKEELEAKKALLNPINAREEEARGERDEKRMERTIILDRSATAAKQIAANHKRSKASEARGTTINRRLGEISTDRATNEMRLAQINSPTDAGSLAVAKTNAAAAEHEHSTCATELEGQRALADLSDSSAAGEMLRKMKLAALAGGELHGVGLLGRLGDLGWTEPQYERAVAMAAGRTLNFIVVKRANDASKCVAFLKAHDLGRATFIILESLKKWSGPVAAIRSGAAAAKQNVPADVAYLFACITPSHAKLDVAFAYALRYTLVADSMEEATRVAYANGENKPAVHRVVSAAGDCIIEKTGVLSGSAKAKAGKGNKRAQQSHRASILTSSAAARAALTFDPAALSGSASGTSSVGANLKALEKRVRALDARRLECCEIVAAIVSESESIAQLLPRLELEESKLRSEASTLDQERTDCAENLAALSGQDKLTIEEKSKLAGIDATLNELEAACAAMAAESADLRAAVKTLQKTIRSAGSKQLVKLQKQLTGAESSLADLRRSLAKSKAQHKTSLKKAQRAAEEAAESKVEAERYASEKSAMETTHGAAADQASEIRRALQEAEASTKQCTKALRALEKELKGITGASAAIEAALADIDASIEDDEAAIKKNSAAESVWQNRMDELDQKWRKCVPPTLAQRGMPSAGGAAEMAAITDASQASLKILEAEALTGLNKAKLELQISVVEDERDEMKSRVDMTAIAVYETKAREQQVKLDELRRSTELRDGARADLDELRKQRFQCFDEGFAIIKTRLKEIYRMLTRGGDAELVSVDSLDPFSEGIKFSVRPPRKCWKEISNLSGGEKTLCSLALVFAMHYFRPTPLYVMDEIDAALDFKNVSIIANYIKERTENAQFIVISLRNNMFEVADRLVGIYKTHNATKSITINPKELAKQLKSGAAKRAAAQLAAQAAPLPLGDATNAGRL